MWLGSDHVRWIEAVNQLGRVRRPTLTAISTYSATKTSANLTYEAESSGLSCCTVASWRSGGVVGHRPIIEVTWHRARLVLGRVAVITQPTRSFSVAFLRGGKLQYSVYFTFAYVIRGRMVTWRPVFRTNFTSVDGGTENYLSSPLYNYVVELSSNAVW